MAPVVRFQGVPWFMKAAQVIDGQLSNFFDGHQIFSLFGADFTDKLKKIEDDKLAGPFIRAFLSALYATDQVNNPKWLQIAANWSPARSSVREVLHYGQMIKSGTFQMYDYEDSATNIKHYGTATPPQLDISKINQVPIAMFVGKNDSLATIKDCQWVKSQISSVVHYQEIDGFDHSSYMAAKDMSYFSSVMGLIEQYNPSN